MGWRLIFPPRDLKGGDLLKTNLFCGGVKKKRGGIEYKGVLRGEIF